MKSGCTKLGAKTRLIINTGAYVLSACLLWPWHQQRPCCVPHSTLNLLQQVAAGLPGAGHQGAGWHLPCNSKSNCCGEEIRLADTFELKQFQARLKPSLAEHAARH